MLQEETSRGTQGCLLILYLLLPPLRIYLLFPLIHYHFLDVFYHIAGGIPRLVALAGASQLSVRIEAIAALANLAVNGTHLLSPDYKHNLTAQTRTHTNTFSPPFTHTHTHFLSHFLSPSLSPFYTHTLQLIISETRCPSFFYYVLSLLLQMPMRWRLFKLMAQSPLFRQEEKSSGCGEEEKKRTEIE